MIEKPEPVEPEAPVPAKPQPPWATARLSPVGREIVQTLLLTVAIFFGIQLFIAQPYQIFQESMERTLEPGQYVLVDKLTPRFDPYKRGDIVVLHPPADWAEPGGAPFIKRVIGVAGDRVAIRDGRVFVNDAELVEPYVYREGGGPQATIATTRACGTKGLIPLSRNPRSPTLKSSPLRT